jgi:hypothetical protein
MIQFILKLIKPKMSIHNGVLHRAHTTRYEDLCQ